MIRKCDNWKGEQMGSHEDMCGKGGAVRLCEQGLNQYREALEAGVMSGDVADCLLACGLLRPLPGSVGVYIPIPPEIAESDLARPVEQKIQNSQQVLTELYTSFLAAKGVYRKVQQQVATPIDTLMGEDVISEALQIAIGKCQGELLTAQPGGGRPTHLLAEALPRDLALLRRGVQQRTLYQHTVRSHAPTLGYIERILAEGGQIQTLDEIFERVIICDRSIAFIPGSPDRKTHAVAIRHPGVVGFLSKAFDHMWERATPVTAVMGQYRPEPLTDVVRRSVLRMVVSGCTDEVIATRLGMSSRTVSTHIRKVSETLGSRSRAELGYLVSEHGLLKDAPADAT